MSATVRIGTSGWAYKDWAGSFYEDGTRTADYLTRYAETFSVVEVDSTFYGIPRRSVVEGWAAKTPSGFVLSPKVPGIVTHGAGGRGERIDVTRVLRDTESLAAFLDALEPLGDKLGPLVFQFPYFRVGTLVLGDFLERLATVLDGIRSRPGSSGKRVAVEIRNKSWLTESYLECLATRGVGSVMVDHPYMPPPLAQLRIGMVTADFAYVRLLGDRYAIEKKTTTWGKIVQDQGERLDDWADAIDTIARRPGVHDIYAFSNNHYAGHAPETCRQLQARVSSRGMAEI